MDTPFRPNRSLVALGAAGLTLGAAAVAAVFAARTGPVGTAPIAATPAAPVFAQRELPRLSTINETNVEDLSNLRVLNESYKNLAKYAGPAVVAIKAESGRAQTAEGMRMPQAAGEGSGFIFRPDGYIITNDHVVDGFDKVTVTLSDGREYPGKVIRAYDSDLAVVKIEAKNLKTLAFADSDKVAPGEFAMAIGAPFGMENSFTFGHVSALHRADTAIGTRLYPDLIQTDTAINMGNSGGPLVDINGRVIGVNTAIFSPSGTSAGIGFAIPANQVRFIAEQLVQKGKVERSYMGVRPVTLKEYRATELGLPGGATLETVESDGPAAAAGLKPGDVVTRIAGREIRTSLDLRNQMLSNPVGSTLEVEYLRGTEKGTARVKLAPIPERLAAQLRPQERAPMRDFREFRLDDDRLPPEMRDFFRNRQIPRGPDTPRSPESLVPPLSEGGPRLGVTVGPLGAMERERFKIPADVKGVLVASVMPGSEAERLGLRAGDVILSIDGSVPASAEDVVAKVRAAKGPLKLKYGRYGNGSVTIVERTATLK